MNRWLIALVIVIIAAIITVTGAISQSRVIEMGVISPEMAQFFQAHANSQDIARVDHPNDIKLIANITVGRKMVIFKSGSEIEQFLASNASSVDVIGYNLEPGQQHDPAELADPFGAAKRVRAIADQYGKQVAIGLTHDLTIQYGAQMAPYADIWVLQIQRAQDDPKMAGEFVNQMLPALKKANPNVAIFVQVRTDSSPQSLISLVNGLGDVNVSILTQKQDVQDAISVASAFFGGNGTTSHLQATSSTPAQWIGDYGIRLKSRDGKWLLPVATRLLGSTDDDHVKRGSINSWDLSAAIGTPAFAAAPGKVVAAGCYLYESGKWSIMQGYGCAVQIDHGGGIHSQYGHCGEGTIAVKPGQMVDQNTLICRVGRTGVTSFNHLHFTILRNGSPIRIDGLFDIKQMRYCHLCSGKNNPDMQIASQSQPQQPTQQSTNRLVALLQVIAGTPQQQLATWVFTACLLMGVVLWLGGLWVRVAVVGLGSGLIGALVVAILLAPITSVQATSQQTPVASGAAWKAAYTFMRKWEGARCVHDPVRTYKGITQGTYSAWLKSQGLVNADVCTALTEQQAEAIYYQRYWIASGADKLSPATAIAVFDHAVNAGVGAASGLLAQCGDNAECVIKARYADYRTKGNFNVYGKAWFNRVNDLVSYLKKGSGS